MDPDRMLQSECGGWAPIKSGDAKLSGDNKFLIPAA